VTGFGIAISNPESLEGLYSAVLDLIMAPSHDGYFIATTPMMTLDCNIDLDSMLSNARALQ